ncbi:STAS domain-containing protein [Streptomyces sp. NPDC017936]|uniref:STAS domain-containing protein n=1 Tax=Streptomyces sp. NPDC017936 TaxID=3365016 RepID=UPI00378CE7BC
MPSPYGAPHRPLPPARATATEEVSVVTLHGDIDHHNAAHLGASLLFPRGTATARTVIDLSAVTFIDSSGINVLIAAHHAARRSGGWLHLAGLTGHVLHTIQLVGLDDVIPCHPTLRHALAALPAPPAAGAEAVRHAPGRAAVPDADGATAHHGAPGRRTKADAAGNTGRPAPVDSTTV